MRARDGRKRTKYEAGIFRKMKKKASGNEMSEIGM